tara:strand:- start:1989 stop:2729 length:741 start_codon:yes stop_codon:yes gene_type:complete
MKKSTFKLLQQSNSKEEILELNELLNKSNIKTKLINSSISSGIQALGVSTIPTFAIHIQQKDFQIANKILERVADNQVNHISKEHYLYNFTDKELYDILENRNEWSHLDYSLSKKILKERGKELKKEDVEKINEKQKLKSKNDMPKHVVLIGYICASGIPLLGIIILPHLLKITNNSIHRMLMTLWAVGGTPIYGMWLAYFFRKKTISYNGEEVYYFQKEIVESGEKINKLSWIFFIFYTLLYFLR